MLTLESRMYTLLLPPPSLFFDLNLKCAFLQKITGDINTFVSHHFIPPPPINVLLQKSSKPPVSLHPTPHHYPSFAGENISDVLSSCKKARSYYALVNVLFCVNARILF